MYLFVDTGLQITEAGNQKPSHIIIWPVTVYQFTQRWLLYCWW